MVFSKAEGVEKRARPAGARHARHAGHILQARAGQNPFGRRLRAFVEWMKEVKQSCSKLTSLSYRNF